MQIKLKPGCIGCGCCTRLLPETFALDERQRAVLCATPPDAIAPGLRLAAASCPAGAIWLE